MPSLTAAFRMPAWRSAVRSGVALAMLVPILAEVGHAGPRRARKHYEQGRTAELEGRFDMALEQYVLAQSEAPGDNRYGLAERRMRFVASQFHVERGLNLRSEGSFEQAVAAFEQALATDPASAVAAQELRRTLDAIETREAGQQEGLPPAALVSALEAERYRRSQRVRSIMAPADLQPLSNQPLNLKLSERAQVVFETIGKLAGLNVLFDSDFSDPEIEIELRNATLTEALDYAGLLSQAFWKPVTHNTLMVIDDNPNKRREFEEEVVKTVYLTNLSTPQDLSEVSTAIRGILDLRRMFTVNSLSAIVMRGPRAKVAIAEKIVHDMDKPRAEVVVDVLVLETSQSNKRVLGLTPRSGGAGGFQFPIALSGGASSGGDGSAATAPTQSLNRLGDLGIGSWSVSLPSFRLTALLSNSSTELLQSPRVRAADNTPADLRIGDRIPIATGSFQPGVGGVGISPLVNTQFQYTDVGVNVSLTPRIHSNRDVSMHVEIEISNVREFVDIGGISQPVIGQRTIQHDVRVREGETSVIGGLNQAQTFRTKSGVPFLGELPVIGRLFSEEDVQVSQSEILIVLVPRIVRMAGIDESNLRPIATGTDQKFELRYAEAGNGKPVFDPAAELATEADGAAEAPAVEPPPAEAAEQPPEPRDSEQEPPGDADPAVTAPETEPQPADDSASVPGLRLSVLPSPLRVAVGERLTVSLQVAGAVQLAAMPLRIQYNREVLQLVDIEKGPFLAGADASDIIFSRSIRHANGLAAANISRFPGAGGADGAGQLAVLTFEGLAAGTAELRITATARDADREPVPVAPLEAEVSAE